MQDAGLCKRWQWPATGRLLPAEALRLARELQVHPLVGQLLLRRGSADSAAARAFLEPRLNHLHDPALLPGAAAAAHRLAQAVRDRQPIVIYGDYDVDGVTASAILWHVLRLAGAQVRTYVPHRIDEGYGLNCEAIARIAAGQTDGPGFGPDGLGETAANPPLTGSAATPLIVSVDCGITALEPAKVAREAKADLIITDHHEFDPAHLPEAHAIVHPRLPGPDGQPAYPFGSLCGAGVALKLAWQFAREHCGSERVPAEFRRLLLDLVSLAALGTVADIVPLVGENRVLTAVGLGQIKRTGLVGLNALIDASGLRQETIDAYHVGFVLGPRLNACGRMGHAARAVHLLTRAGPEEAAEIAAFLTKENERRRATEKTIFEEARQMVLEAGYHQPDCRAIVLGQAGWHPGVIGIVASRLVEAFARPVVLLALDDGEAHGSARSVAGLSIHDAFVHCAQHLLSYGGHAMAAGLRLETSQIDAFRAALVSYANARLRPEDLATVVEVDADCAIDDLTPELCRALGQLAPFGRDNPAPVFCLRDATVNLPAQRMGAGGRHLRLMLRQGQRFVGAVWFGAGERAEQLPLGARVDVVFEPKTSTWQGQCRVELHVRDIKVHGPAGRP